MPVHEHGSRPYEWVGAWSERRASLTPNKIGLVDATTDTELTYAELDERATRTATLLTESGVSEGERVAVISRNRPATVDLFNATGKTGGILAPLSHRLTPRELVPMLNDVDPRLLVVEEEFADLAVDLLEHEDAAFDPITYSLKTAGSTTFDRFSRAVPDSAGELANPDLAMDDPHLLLHTGGTTGIPKETVVTHGSIYWNSFNTITAWGLRDTDVTPMVYPTFHTGGWNVLTVPLFHMGGTVVITRAFDAGQVLSIIEDRGATIFVGAPAMLRMMAQHDAWAESDLSTLRFVKSGGGPCREPVMEAWWDRGVDLSQGYGLTECGPNNFEMPADWPREKAESVGVPVMHLDIRIVDDGEEVDRGEVGELELASPHAADRYWANAEETEETFGGAWVSTGDLARRDEAGYVYIVGRKKNMYVSGGENVYPPEVENVISGHTDVAEVVIIPIPDDRWGQVGKAVVEGDPDLTLEELHDFLEGRLATFKWPRELAFIDEMPMSGPSKIDREAVAEAYGE
ncbi:MAG: AMP-binding protein [Halodesulfurarchaeum sp.]